MKNDCYFSSVKLRNAVLEEIRDAIKDNRQRGITQELLARELGISREQLSRLLHGDYSLSSDYLFYLIVRLGLNKAYFNR